jgi:D-lactate dehydrogenase
VNTKDRRADYRALPENYLSWHDAIAERIPPSRIYCDPLRTFAWGTDASCYRLIPKIVVKAHSTDEVALLLRASKRFAVPLTFRAAGTSLSGQAVTDSVLVLLSGGWKGGRVLGSGDRIALEPGVIGAEANELLARYGRKIGPDPASINHAMIGGIAANNASGMCCGTAQNSYRTVESMKVVLVDGSLLDTADPASRESFAATHAELIAELTRIRDETLADAALSARIAEKFRIKNTTGYGINAFIDYADPVDILLHLMIGSEGTLAFISEVTYRTVEEHAHKASALIVFPDLGRACEATTRLKSGPVAAVELMDRASLRSVENEAGMPGYLRGLDAKATALLVETRAADAPALARQVEEISKLLEGLPTVFPVSFTDRKAEYEQLWHVRKGLFPAVGAVRRAGTTVVIEDVVFPIERLAEATTELQALMLARGYSEGIIFGHALEGNLHFVFTQDFGDPAEVARYQSFMDAVCDMVVHTYDGSLKGEHGTGRNMAPFVEMEWGAKAYTLMRRVKKAFDPEGILNPGVVIGDDPRAHIEHLKALPKANELIDKCIECGFCEVNCPSKELTISPRQRITVTREIARLRESWSAAGSEGGRCEGLAPLDTRRLARLEADYLYQGERTCATDGLCAAACPVGIDTGKHTKALRHGQNGPLSRATAQALGDHFAGLATGLRVGLTAVGLARAVLGPSALGGVASFARAASGNMLPLWNRSMPRASSKIGGAPLAVKTLGETLAARTAAEAVTDGKALAATKRVVYFPSCIVRAMGPAPGDPDQRSLHEAMLSLLAKGGYEAVFPEAMASLCCGMAFGSKGFTEVAEQKRKELEAALLEASRGGEYPILFDTSPCLYTVKGGADARLRLYEPVEFIGTFLLDALEFERSPETIAIHITCSSRKMGLVEAFLKVALVLSEKVVVPPRVGCCGVAGDRIFFFPELSTSALAELKGSLPADCRSGYSNSRTCEIGLSLEGGIPYQSIVYLADRLARPQDFR